MTTPTPKSEWDELREALSAALDHFEHDRYHAALAGNPLNPAAILWVAEQIWKRDTVGRSALREGEGR